MLLTFEIESFHSFTENYFLMVGSLFLGLPSIIALVLPLFTLVVSIIPVRKERKSSRKQVTVFTGHIQGSWAPAGGIIFIQLR